MSKDLTISIVGTGYVGLTSAAVLANAGYKVFTVDVDPKKIEVIKSGKSYFFEAGLDEFVGNAIKSGNLYPTLSYEESIPESDIVFSCVGTPDREDGSTNLDFIFQAADSVAKYAKKGVIMVQKSTVPAGTGRKVIARMKTVNPELDFAYVSNPEFLREGSALFDTLNMDRIVVGSDDKEALEKVVSVFDEVDEFSRSIDHSKYNDYATAYVSKVGNYAKAPFEERVYKMGLESAELVKVSANAFLALKISFANSIAKLADQAGAEITEVMDGVGSDFRIGRAFLYAGLGWGGGCFPKDVSGLIAVAKEYGIGMPIMEAAVTENFSMTDYAIGKFKKLVNGNISKMKVAVLGLSFKPGTSDVRKSPAIRLTNALVKEGVAVVAYDPQAMEEAKHDTDPSVGMVGSIETCIHDADAVFLATDWKEFSAFDWNKAKTLMKGDIVVDTRNFLDPKMIKEAGLRYIGIGRGEK